MEFYRLHYGTRIGQVYIPIWISVEWDFMTAGLLLYQCTGLVTGEPKVLIHIFMLPIYVTKVVRGVVMVGWNGTFDTVYFGKLNDRKL